MPASIDAESLKQYLADNPPAVVPLAIKPHFESLSDKEKLYAHHISMYAPPRPRPGTMRVAKARHIRGLVRNNTC